MVPPLVFTLAFLRSSLIKTTNDRMLALLLLVPFFFFFKFGISVPYYKFLCSIRYLAFRTGTINVNA